MGSIGVNETQVLAALDELIERSAPSDFSALVVALSARLSALGALALNATAKRQAQSTAEEPERNLSAKEAAGRLGVSTAYLYKNARRFPFALRIGRRLLFSSRGLVTTWDTEGRLAANRASIIILRTTGTALRYERWAAGSAASLASAGSSLRSRREAAQSRPAVDLGSSAVYR